MILTQVFYVTIFIHSVDKTTRKGHRPVEGDGAEGMEVDLAEGEAESEAEDAHPFRHEDSSIPLDLDATRGEHGQPHDAHGEQAGRKVNHESCGGTLAELPAVQETQGGQQVPFGRTNRTALTPIP